MFDPVAKKINEDASDCLHRPLISNSGQAEANEFPLLSMAETHADTSERSSIAPQAEGNSIYKRTTFELENRALQPTASTTADEEMGLSQGLSNATKIGLLMPSSIQSRRSYHQDFYESKWFKGTQVLIVLWVMANILFITVQGSGTGWYALAPELTALVFVLMFWVMGGITGVRSTNKPCSIKSLQLFWEVLLSSHQSIMRSLLVSSRCC